jgi:hypothetical protein
MGHRLRSENCRWPDGKIYYQYTFPDESTDSGRRDLEQIQELNLVQTIENCMLKWTQLVNADGVRHIEFVPRKGKGIFKNIDLSVGGVTTSGENGYDGKSKFTIAWKSPDDNIKSIPHELGHILGLLHENDRVVGFHGDKQNLWDGTNPMMCPTDYGDNAMIVERLKRKRDTYLPVGGYDIWSIMHYPENKYYEWNCGHEGLRKYMDAHPDPLFKQARPALDYGDWVKNQRMPCPLNYPTRQEVEMGTWSPSLGDVLTIRDWYS